MEVVVIVCSSAMEKWSSGGGASVGCVCAYVCVVGGRWQNVKVMAICDSAPSSVVATRIAPT